MLCNMLNCKRSKNNRLQFLIVFITVIGILPFSIQAQEDGAGPTLDIDKVKKEAWKGNADAMFVLGNAYLYGKYVSKDSVEAIKWITKAAERGKPIAMYALGNLYDNGKAVSKDTALALKW